MKTLLSTLMGALILLPMTFSKVQAQDDDRPGFVVFTRTHWNMTLPDSEESRKDWYDHEKEYLDKVTMKNDHVMGTSVLRHVYTEDNSEVILVSVYKTWNDIELASAKYDELEAAAWPNRNDRRAFFREWNKYYENRHSDEIYETLAGAKLPAQPNDSSVIVYIQKVYRAYPEDGTNAEFEALRLEYAQKVIHKNPYVKAYYPMRHAWGSDNRELVDVFIVDSVCDVAMMNQSYDDLENAAWPNEKDRKAFFEKLDKYYSGQHGDYIYATIPGVSK